MNTMTSPSLAVTYWLNALNNWMQIKYMLLELLTRMISESSASISSNNSCSMA